MAKGYYKCECGQAFVEPQKFNGHKRRCKVHLLLKYGTEAPFEAVETKCTEVLVKAAAAKAERLRNKKAARQLEETLDWQNNPHICECCGKLMSIKFGSGRFCSVSCAHSHPRKNKTSGFHTPTPSNRPTGIYPKYESANAAREARRAEAFARFLVRAPKCRICGALLSYEKRDKKTCGSKECVHAAIRAGRLTAMARANRRSKNEICFYELCKEHFSTVLHNEAIFNGWDADVIIPEIKYAILWNGPWHYKQIKRTSSLKQIQNRDRIKIQEIYKAGYTPYVIQDMGSHNERFVQQKFEEFLGTLKDLPSSKDRDCNPVT